MVFESGSGQHPNMDVGVEKKLRALVLLMRYSGLRITDAVTLIVALIKELLGLFQEGGLQKELGGRIS